MDDIHTIGHSRHTLDKLIELLSMHGIARVADVRSQPYSRRNPQFNRETLSGALAEAGIEYAFLGRELGARSEDPGCYLAGRVSFDLLARTLLFRQGLEIVEREARARRLALMCAEKDPLICHRTILVCRQLASRGLDARHILEDGRIESHQDALTRLLAEHGIKDRELFQSREELVAEAYTRRGRRIAYREK